ncbi:MAG: hypothetical protein ABSH32_00740 [Bryobacteraceae bacterium]|jgi:hypothetical protein
MEFFREWADPASVLGFLVSLIGFFITIVVVLRSKSAAERTGQAVAEVRQKLMRQTAVFDLNRVLADVDELKALHRASVWELLPARYSSLRRQLAGFRGTYPDLTRRQKATIQGIISQFSEIESIVEKSLATKQAPPDPPSLNRIAAEQSDKLNDIVIAVQQTIGGANA